MAERFDAFQDQIDNVVSSWRNSAEVKARISALEEELLLAAHNARSANSKPKILKLARVKVEEILRTHSKDYGMLSDILKKAVIDQLAELFATDAIERLEDV